MTAVLTAQLLGESAAVADALGLLFAELEYFHLANPASVRCRRRQSNRLISRSYWWRQCSTNPTAAA